MLKYGVFSRSACSAIASPEAELISPISATTLSRSISFCALVTRSAGLTLSSAITSILRPRMPPAALISSTASLTRITAYSPSGPRNPVSGVRCPSRTVSD